MIPSITGLVASYYSNKAYISYLKTKIEDYERGKDEAKAAKQLFTSAKTKLDSEYDALAHVFQGSTGDVYLENMHNVSKRLKRGKESMDELIKQYNKKIKSLETLKRQSEIYVNTIDDIINGIVSIFR